MSDKVAIAMDEMASMLNKKNQAQVVKVRINRMPAKAMYVATVLHVEELRNVTDQEIVRVTSIDRQNVNNRQGYMWGNLGLLPEIYHQEIWSKFDPV